jgi:hypothetical protein
MPRKSIAREKKAKEKKRGKWGGANGEKGFACPLHAPQIGHVHAAQHL